MYHFGMLGSWLVTRPRPNRALRLLREVWKTRYASTTLPQPDTPNPASDSSLRSRLNRYREQRHGPAASQVRDQLEAYLAQGTEDCGDPIRWWYDKLTRNEWPELAQMALDYLSVPGKFCAIS